MTETYADRNYGRAQPNTVNGVCVWLPPLTPGFAPGFVKRGVTAEPASNRQPASLAGGPPSLPACRALQRGFINSMTSNKMESGGPEWLGLRSSSGGLSLITVRFNNISILRRSEVQNPGATFRF